MRSQIVSRPASLVVTWYAITACLLLNIASAVQFPLASQDQAFKVGGYRVVDLIMIACVVWGALRALSQGLEYRRAVIIASWVTIVTVAWSVLAALGLANLPIDPRSLIAELQPLAYLLGTALIAAQMSSELLREMIRKTAIILGSASVLACLVVLGSGMDVGGDLSSLALISTLVAIGTRLPPIATLAVAGSTLVLLLRSEQRAALLVAGIVAILGVVVWRWRDFFSAWTTVVVSGAVAVAGTILLFTSALADSIRSITTYVEFAFFRDAKLDSATSRVTQWETGMELLSAQPFTGYGVGFRYIYFDPASGSEVVSNLTHNVVLDILLRFGLVLGLLGLVASAWVLLAALWAARRSSDVLLWCLSLGIASLAAKGMVESVLFKPRLALALCVLVTLVICISSPNRMSATGAHLGNSRNFFAQRVAAQQVFRK